MRSVLSQRVFSSYALTPLMLITLAWWIGVTLTSSMPSTSLITVAMLVGLPVLYLTLTNTPSFAAHWVNIRKLLFILAVILAAWALLQVQSHTGNGDAVGPLKDRNAFAALMNVLWFPAAFLFLTHISSQHRLRSAGLSLGLLIIATALFSTTSRGGIATWLLLMPIFLWAGYRHAYKNILWIVLIAILAYYISDFSLHSTVANRTFHLSQDASTSARLMLWHSAMQIAVHHPLFGTGWGSFFAYYPAVRSPLEVQSIGGFAHNDYLQFAAEGGFPALLLLFALAVGVALRLQQALKAAPGRDHFESVSLLLGVCALFIHATLNFIFYYAFMNIFVGLYLARVAYILESPRPFRIPNLCPTSTRLQSGLISTAVLLCTVPYLITLIAQACLSDSQPGLKAIQMLTPRVHGEDIASILSVFRPADPYVEDFMMQAAQTRLANSLNHDNQQQQVAALRHLIQVLDTARANDHDNPNIGVVEAQLLMRNCHLLPSQQAYVLASSILQQNLLINPYHTDSMILLAQLQRDTGHPKLAFRTLNWANQHVLFLFDQQMIKAELLREQAAPRVIPELAQIQQQLHMLRYDSETATPLSNATQINQNIAVQLAKIAQQLTPTLTP